MLRKSLMKFIFICILTFVVLRPCQGGTDTGVSTPSSSDDGVIVNWLKSVSAIQAEQPHWATPVVTVTPRLEQEFRYDQFWQYGTKGHELNSYGGGKGLEFVLTTI